MSARDLRTFVQVTVSVLTTRRDRLAEWRGQLEEAIATAQQAGAAADAEFLAALKETVEGGKPQLPSDHPYARALWEVRAALGASQPTPALLTPEELQALVRNTVGALTVAPDRRDEWRAQLDQVLAEVRQRGAAWQREVELLAAVRSLLDRPAAPVRLGDDHPYAAVLAAIEQGLVAATEPAQTDEPEAPKGVAIELSTATVNAVEAYIAAPDWAAARAVIESQGLPLLAPEAELLLQGMAAQAEAQGRTGYADRLAQRLAVLRACQAAGIEETFRRLGA